MIKTGKSYHQYKVFAFSYLRCRGVYAVNFTQGFNGWSLFLNQMDSFSWTLPTYSLELPCIVTCGVESHKDNLHHLASAHLQGKLQNSLLWPPIAQVSLTNSFWEGTLPWKCQETENPPLSFTCYSCLSCTVTSSSSCLWQASFPPYRDSLPALNLPWTSGGWRLSHHKSLSRLSDHFCSSSMLVSLRSFPKCLMEKKNRKKKAMWEIFHSLVKPPSPLLPGHIPREFTGAFFLPGVFSCLFPTDREVIFRAPKDRGWQEQNHFPPLCS